MKVLLFFLYLLIFFPYISFLPTDNDLQPLFIIPAILLLIIKKSRLKILWIVLFIGFASLFYINIFNNIFVPYKGFGAYFSLCISAILFVVFNEIEDEFLLLEVLKISIIIYFIGSVLYFIYPDIFSTFQSRIVRSVNTLEDGISYRGVSTFFTEPGLLGAHMIALAVILTRYYKLSKIVLNHYLIYLTMLVLIILLTKSGFGYSYLILFSILVFFTFKIKIYYKFLIGSLFVVIGIYAYNYITTQFDISNRGLDALTTLSSSQIEDFSILKRIYDFKLGFYLLPINPFGFGVNFNINVLLNSIQSNLYLRQFYGNSEFGFVSSLSLWFAYYGVFAILYICTIIYISKPNLIQITFALLFLSFSFSASYPLIWLLLSPLFNNNTRKLSA